MLKQRNAAAHSWASCNLVCTLKNLKHLCLFSPPLAGKWFQEKSRSLLLSALNSNVKEAVDQYIVISTCKWDLRWQDIFSASESYYKAEIIKSLPQSDSEQQVPEFWMYVVFLPTVLFADDFPVWLSCFPFLHSYVAMVTFLLLNTVVFTEDGVVTGKQGLLFWLKGRVDCSWVLLGSIKSLWAYDDEPNPYSALPCSTSWLNRACPFWPKGLALLHSLWEHVSLTH